MFIQKFSIKINSDIARDEVLEAFDLLQEFYRGNGQTIGKVTLEYHLENELICLPYTLETDSLSEKNNNFYVNREIARLQDLCKSKLEISLHGSIGTEFPKSESIEAYILKTDYTSVNSPLLNEKSRGIPLYKLPQYYDHSYMPILAWETNYKACDDLFMNGEVGERWALNQLQDFKSNLSKQGRTICENIEAKTNIPTYYYLFNYKKKNSAFCPSCKQSWVPDKIFEGFHYRCDPCRLISNKTLNY